MIVNRNIDLVQINLQENQTEYYFPRNVEWRGKTISRILLYMAADAEENPMLSPVDGITPVVQESQITSDLYINLYDDTDKDIARNASFRTIYYKNNHVLEINRPISLSLSNIVFTTETIPTGCLLFFVEYGNTTTEETPSKAVTVTFPLSANQQLSFTDLVNEYIHQQLLPVKGITSWGTSPAFMTLRDETDTVIFNNVVTDLMRPQNQTDASPQAYPFLLDNIDIDFDNSHIYNPYDVAINMTLTFYY